MTKGIRFTDEDCEVVELEVRRGGLCMVNGVWSQQRLLARWALLESE